MKLAKNDFTSSWQWDCRSDFSIISVCFDGTVWYLVVLEMRLQNLVKFNDHLVTQAMWHRRSVAVSCASTVLILWVVPDFLFSVYCRLITILCAFVIEERSSWWWWWTMQAYIVCVMLILLHVVAPRTCPCWWQAPKL